MSHIDSFRHQQVGILAGLPVYLPLEDIDGEFRCTRQQLLIGGGSGEHPALVLQDPQAAVALFLHRALARQTSATDLRPAYEAHVPHHWSRLLTYWDWDLETYARFHARLGSEVLPEPYALHRETLALEEWLVLGLGEFVYYALPQLAPDILSKLQAPYAIFRHAHYNNVLLVPPNMPVYANGGNRFFPRAA